MANDLAKLNRLRVNAGKTELKSWKASQSKLDSAVIVLETHGFTDVLPGANADAAPVIDDPEIAAARPAEEPVEVTRDEDSSKKTERKVTQGKPSLARGLDTDDYAKMSRKAVRDHREKEKKDKALLSPEDKAQIKAEAALRKGEVDPKKDPAKAARQKQHIADKQAKREKAGKVSKAKVLNENEISVADIARKLDIDPKVARAKLRRHEAKINKLHTKGQDRWTFPKSAEKAITEILK